MNITDTDNSSRPLGFWLKAIDRLMAVEFGTAFESEGVTRREWRLLNIIAGDRAPQHDRPLDARTLDRLINLGWVTDADGSWTLTDEGRAAKNRLSDIVDGIRAKVTDAVPADDLATTVAALEQIARAFGWDEATPLPRRRGGHERFGRHGFGRHGFGRHGFGRPGRGLGRPGRRFGHEAHGMPGADKGEDCRHGASDRFGDHERDAEHDGPRGRRRGRMRARFAQFAQGAYERGFDAGFTRGRADR